MPYIPTARRLALYEEIDSPVNAGELNYKFTCLAIEYVGSNPTYQKFNDVIGALEGAKMELYRRAVAPYEDKKIKENGDIYYGTEQQAAEAAAPQELRSEGVEL